LLFEIWIDFRTTKNSFHISFTDNCHQIFSELDEVILHGYNCFRLYNGYIYGGTIKEFSMTPLPKRKVSSARRDRRRANDFLTPNNLTACSNCGEMCLPHTVCPSCGYYKGREVINVTKKEAKKE